MMKGLEIIVGLIGAIVTIVVSIGGAWVAVKVTLAKHDERITNLAEEYKIIQKDIKAMYRVIAGMDKTLAVINERTKKE